MKIKSAQKKPLLHKARRGNKQHDLLVVKSESELHLGGEDDEDSNEAHTNGLGVQIKEEQHSQDISGDTSSCIDTNGAVTSRSEVALPLENIKEDPDSDHQPDYEFTKVEIKEESELCIKEERGGEEDGEETDDAGKIQENADEDGLERDGKGTSRVQVHDYYVMILWLSIYNQNTNPQHDDFCYLW